MNAKNVPHNPLTQAEQYAALTEHAGWVDISNRTRIEISGADRVRFLHGFCTNDINQLASGAGCEAMLLDVKGRVLGYVFVVNQGDALLLETAPDQATRIISHLDRYVITDDVVFQDLADSHAELLLAGEKSPAVLQTIFGAPPPEENLAGQMYSRDALQARILRTPLAGADCFQLLAPREQAAALQSLLGSEGAQPCTAEILDAVRIEAGVPEYGRDISDENLPQEVGRNTQAISFTKGCYLGQETVARIDALGHVNRQLVGLRFDLSEPPPAGTTLWADDAEIGVLTSAAYSPRREAVVALAMVRTRYEQPGQPLNAHVGARVLACVVTEAVR